MLLRALAATLLVLAAGCAQSPVSGSTADLEDTSAAEATAGPLAWLTGCGGYNAFVAMSPDSARRHIPSNWTPMTFHGGATTSLRMMALRCDQASLLLLGGPVLTDATPPENPDFVYGFWTDAPAVAAAYAALRVPGGLAEFQWGTSAAGTPTVTVSSAAGPVASMQGVDPGRPGGRYEIHAEYAHSRDDLTWSSGLEVSEATSIVAVRVEVGPASGLDAATIPPAAFAQLWSLDTLEYRAGRAPAGHA